jgi:hypothetical protein
MPGWLTEVLKALGFTTPFIYAAATYGAFHYLDKKASGPAKRTISAWINSTYIDKQQSAAIAVEIFDRIYTVPLWGWRAIVRSIIFTTIITVLLVWHLYSAMFWLARVVPFDIQIQWLQRILCNFAADYAALYLIRRWLILGGARPLLAALAGPLIGVAVLLAIYTVTDVLRFSIETWTFHPIYFVQGALYWIISFGDLHEGSRTALLLPALIIHLWLPLFAIGVLLTQLANYLFKATSWMQWFIKQGQYHPLQAIGYIAATVVFFGTIIGQLIASRIH